MIFLFHKMAGNATLKLLRYLSAFFICLPASQLEGSLFPLPWRERVRVRGMKWLNSHMPVQGYRYTESPSPIASQSASSLKGEAIAPEPLPIASAMLLRPLLARDKILRGKIFIWGQIFVKNTKVRGQTTRGQNIRKDRV